MKRLATVLVTLMLCANAFATNAVIVIADSIGSDMAEGQASQHFLSLVTAERDVLFRVIGSPGSSLGSDDKTGFNSQRVIDAIDLISGSYGWYSKVIIQAGTNDFTNSLPWSSTVTSLRRILAKVRADARTAYVLEPIYRDGENVPNAAGNTLNTYRYFMAFVCQQEYGDVCTFVPRSTSGMGSITNNYAASEVSQGKRLHPNVMGNRKIADWIKSEIFPLSSARKTQHKKSR